MTELEEWLAQARRLPFKHQVVGVQRILDNPYFFLMDEMGAGKTKQTIDAAQILFRKGLISRVIVVSPAAVRSVWVDPERGELAKHCWSNTPNTVTEYHIRQRSWQYGPDGHVRLEWLVTNYDFIRSKMRLIKLLRAADRHTMLVLDESSSVSNWRALQTKACRQLRAKCGRVLLLNGTPISHSPLDMFSQGNLMNPSILNCPSYTQFKARYAIMGGYVAEFVRGGKTIKQPVQIVGWRDLEDLQRRFAPFAIRRLKKDCLDLPPKLDPVTLTVPLTPESWKLYKEMRDDLVAWLSDNSVSVAAQAIVKVLRLQQITSGFIGGVEAALVDQQNAERPPWLPFPDGPPLQSTIAAGPSETIKFFGTEKLDVLLEQVDRALASDPAFKLLLWFHFRPELQRAEQILMQDARYKDVLVGAIHGDQTRDKWKTVNGKQVLIREGDRDRALRLLDPDVSPKDKPVVVLGTPSTGSMGLNLSAAHTVIYASSDYSLKTRKQSEDRVHRPGQIYPVSYYDIVATGPNGQKTIDHHVVKALQDKVNLADWTTSAWIQALTEE